MKRNLLLAFLFLSLLGFGLYLLLFPNQRPQLIDAHKPATLSVDRQEKDLGVIPMEKPASVNYRLTNTGGKNLVVSKVEASCGCTATKLERDTLSPGDSANLTVTLDTAIKLGPILKTIDVLSNDPAHPKTSLRLRANVQPPKGMASAGAIHVKDPLVLFKGTCKTCHVDRGINKTGKNLFIADCAMCHGPNAEGGVSPSLLQGDYSSEQGKAYARNIIANGSPNSPTMAPFSQAKGGPLSEGQIDSLVVFLAYQQQQFKAGKLKLEAKDSQHHAHVQ